MTKVRWGILSTAKIAREKVIPAMQGGLFCDVQAIASRNKDQALAVSLNLNIPKAYGSYEDLLQDPEIDAIYIPLPNNMHLEWTLKAIQAGKHVLCEKPVTCTVSEARQLLEITRQRPGLKVMEAFMYRFHPQWQHAKKLVAEGKIGILKTIQSFFSYYNVDPNNIRNNPDAGGGGLMDIGCYCISLSRFIFDQEPQRVLGTIEYDPVLKTDRMASGMLDFSTGTATFTCSTQLVPYQRVNIFGTEARIEIEIPFNAPPDKPTRLWVHSKTGTEEVTFDAVDQYTIQCDLFSKAIIDNTAVPTVPEDAFHNMTIIESLVESAQGNKWVHPEHAGL